MCQEHSRQRKASCARVKRTTAENCFLLKEHVTARKERPRAPGIFRWHQGNQAISRVVISLPDTDVHQPKGLGKAKLSLHLEPATGIYRPCQFQGEGEASGGSRWHPGPVECANLPSPRLREDKRAGLQQVERPSPQ